MIVELGDLRVETLPEDAIVKFKLTDLTNWYAGPPIRTDVEDMPASDGAFEPDRSYRGAKRMTLEGVVTSSSAEAAVADGWLRINALAPLGEALELKVTDPTGTYNMQVRLNGTPLVLPFTDRRARFQVPIVAADGRKYGPWEEQEAKPAGTSGDGLKYPLFGPRNTGVLDFGDFSPSGYVELVNTGRAPSWPVFLVRGAIGSAGFQIVSEDRVIEYAAAVPLGSVLVLSPYAGGRASIAGVDVTGGNLTRSEWTPILPGETRAFVFNPLGTFDQNALMTTRFRKAWW